MSSDESSQSPNFKRKNPIQNRAVETVNSVLEAAARVLIRDTFDGLNIKKVIEVAGVSVGSFYQYFSGKESLFAALVESEINSNLSELKTCLREMESMEPLAAVEKLVLKLIELNRRRQGLRKVMLEQIDKAGLRGRVKQAEEEIVDLVAVFIRTRVGRNPHIHPDISKYIVRKAILGAIHHAVIEDSPYLEHPDFARGIAHVLLAFLPTGPDVPQYRGQGGTLSMVTDESNDGSKRNAS